MYDTEHIHVEEGLRLHWIADFNEFKGFLSSPLIGLKLGIHISSGSAEKVRYKT